MSERDDLDQLLAHPGWLRFIAHCREEWGSVAYARRIKAAVAVNNLQQVQVVDRVNDELNILLNWPSECVRASDRHTASEHEPVTRTRGGQ